MSTRLYTIHINLLVEDAIRIQASALEKRDIAVRKDLVQGLPSVCSEGTGKGAIATMRLPVEHAGDKEETGGEE